MKTPHEITLERERKVWRLRLKSWSQENIAAELGITQSAVSQILKRLFERYYEENMVEIEQVKVEQVAQLEYIASEAMRAWVRSKKNSQRKNDVRYLSAAMKAKEDIRKILGIDAPSKIEHSGVLQEFENMSDEDLRARVRGILDDRVQEVV